MVEKIDLRQRGAGVHHPDVAKLIAQCDGIIDRAEKLAGVGQGTFGKIRRGEAPYSDYIKQRIDAALAGNPIPKDTIMKQPATLALPETCPPLLAELIRFCGSKAKAARTLGTSEGTLYGVISGKPMPSAWVVRAKAQLGQPVIGAPSPANAPEGDEQTAPFVLWDGKSKGNFKTRAHGKSPSRTIKNVPQPILDLLAKHGGVVQRASSAAGITGNTIFKWMEGMAFTEDRQRVIHNAMHGKPTGMTNTMGEDYDKYTLGIAICMLKGSSFDRINDIADILNGKLIFRKNTKEGWIIMYKLAIDDLAKFKKLAMRDANEIICP